MCIRDSLKVLDKPQQSSSCAGQAKGNKDNKGGNSKGKEQNSKSIDKAKPKCRRCAKQHDVSNCSHKYNDVHCDNCDIDGHMTKACISNGKGKSWQGNSGNRGRSRSTKKTSNSDNNSGNRSQSASPTFRGANANHVNVAHCYVSRTPVSYTHLRAHETPEHLE